MLIFRALLDQTQRNAKPETAVLFTKNQTKGTLFGTNDHVFACIKLNRLSISFKNSSSRPPNTTIECKLMIISSHKYLYGIRFLVILYKLPLCSYSISLHTANVQHLKYGVTQCVLSLYKFSFLSVFLHSET